MRFLLSILIFVFIISFSNAQEICLQLDSIECYRVPWQLKSNTNIYKNEIIFEEQFSLYRVKKVVKDRQALKYFIEVNFIDTSKVLSLNKSVDEIDARAVIILHYNSGKQDTIVFNVNSSYHFGNKVYFSNIKLLLWLIEYNPLSDPKSEFIKSEDLDKFKEKYDFMTKKNE